MKNIEILMGNKLMETLKWNKDTEKYTVEIYNDFVLYMVFPEEGEYTKEEVAKELQKRSVYSDEDRRKYFKDKIKDYSIFSQIEIDNLRTVNDIFWVRYEGDKSTWDTVKFEWEASDQKEDKFIELFNDRFNKFVEMKSKNK